MINLQQRGMRGSVRVKGRETLLSVPQRCLKAPLTPFIVEDSRGILDPVATFDERQPVQERHGGERLDRRLS